jgi:uncharacterized alkaline shock family protein YloU
MAEKFATDGLTIAPGVVETILAQTILGIDGVAKVGTPKPTDGLLGVGKKRNPAQGVLLMADAGQITVAVHICVLFGYRLQDVADEVRSAVAEALEGQIGVTASAVDIYVDGIAFPE